MNNPNNNQVLLGSSVLILINNKKVKYEIVNSSEVDIKENKISSACPLGKTLIGAEKGEERTFIVGDKKRNVKILDIK